MSNQTKILFVAAIMGLSVQGLSAAHAQNFSAASAQDIGAPSGYSHGNNGSYNNLGSLTFPTESSIETTGAFCDGHLPAELVSAFEALDNGDLVEAKTAFENQFKKVKRFRSCESAYITYGLGVTRYNNENWQSARRHLSDFVFYYDPYNYEARRYLGLAYVNSGMKMLAKKHLNVLKNQQRSCADECPPTLVAAVNELSTAITTAS